MNLLLLDFESTGIDPLADRITEYFFELYDPEKDLSYDISEGLVWDENYPPISTEVEELVGISSEELRSLGKNPKEILSEYQRMAQEANYVVAHNGKVFDKILLETEFTRQGMPQHHLPWICTRFDMPYPAKQKCRKLSHIAVDHGILVDPSKLHSAEGDVWLMKEILKKYDIHKVIEYAESPNIYLISSVGYNDRQLAKDRGYSWETPANTKRFFSKSWVKCIKECELKGALEEAAEAPFKVTIVRD